MLGTINGNSAKALAASSAYFSGRSAAGVLTAAHTSLSLTASEQTVTLSISHDAISALISSGSASASLDATSGAGGTAAPLSAAAAAAEQQARQGQDALGSMKAAQTQAANFTKDFLRQKLEGYKRQLELLRMLGSDPEKIAKDALRIAKGVAAIILSNRQPPYTANIAFTYSGRSGMRRAGLPVASRNAPAIAGAASALALSEPCP